MAVTNLATFRERVMALYRATPHPNLLGRITQADLATEAGLSASELSRRLSGKGDVALTGDNVRAIVRALAKLGALQTQAEALELLRLAGCLPFSATEWQSPPFDQLAPLNPDQIAGAGNLPLPLTSFFGRAADMAEAVALLAETRLLTITGIGGIGKTRFAVELARHLLPEYTDGVYLVELAQLASGSLLPVSVASNLAVREEPGRPLLDTLLDRIAPRHLLLVLDNCEHLAAAAAQLARQLLSRCRRLTIIATSREPLGLAAETSWPLPSLAVPAADVAAIEQVQQSAAAQLFVARARTAAPGFRLTAKNALAVATLSRQLEGLPLAIELAAPLVRTLTIEQLSHRLADRLRLLQSDEPTLPARQRSLMASIAWSYDLLTGAERVLLRRLAVFVGGWELEAAEAICPGNYSSNGQDQVDLQPGGANISPHFGNLNLQSAIYNLQSDEVLAGHVQLVNKSLVQTAEQDSAMRYRLLETVREYAVAQLGRSGEEPALRQAHAQMYLALAEQAESQLLGAEQAKWLNRLDAELDNFRAALSWALASTSGGEVGLRLAGALTRFWLNRGYLKEGLRWTQQMLAKASAGRTASRARALNSAGTLAHREGDYAKAGEYYEQSLALWRELGDRRGTASALGNLGMIAAALSDFPTAINLYHESLALRRELGDDWAVAIALANLGSLAFRAGDYPTAKAQHSESLTIQRRLGNRFGTANSLSILGSVAIKEGDYPQAHALLGESLAIRQELGDKVGISDSLGRLAQLSAAEGQLEAAARLFGAAERLRLAINAPLEPTERADYEYYIALARASIHAPSFELAFREGQSAPAEQVVEYALGLTR